MRGYTGNIFSENLLTGLRAMAGLRDSDNAEDYATKEEMEREYALENAGNIIQGLMSHIDNNHEAYFLLEHAIDHLNSDRVYPCSHCNLKGGH